MMIGGGAALGFLVRHYCEERQLEEVPRELLFSWGRGREFPFRSKVNSRRNPSHGGYQFPEFTGNPKRHLESNMMANWLLSELCQQTETRFRALEYRKRLWAFQSALFMIGYQVNTQKGNDELS